MMWCREYREAIVGQPVLPFRRGTVVWTYCLFQTLVTRSDNDNVDRRYGILLKVHVTGRDIPADAQERMLDIISY
ncbi:hypothetical protein AKJ16_DCAP03181 [Drosera capensis]